MRESHRRRLNDLLTQHRFIWLLVTLLSFFVTLPTLQMMREGELPGLPEFLETLAFVVVLLVIVMSISRRQSWKLAAIVLGLAAVFLWLLPPQITTHAVRVLRHLCAAAFLAHAIVSILLLIFTTSKVTMNLLCASLCVYLLLGLLWGILYSLVTLSDPDAFKHTLPDGSPTHVMRMDMGNTATAAYFSYATLTTLGYGDIVPATPLTRMLATLEAIIGQLFLAVLVARLVGMHIVASTAAGSGDPRRARMDEREV